MDDKPLMLSPDMIRLGGEQPVRMAVDRTEPEPPQPLISTAPHHASAMPEYSARVTFEWRKNEPLAQPVVKVR